MIQREYDKLLHLLSRHTNLMVPYSDYVNGHTFPAQISELLGTKIKLTYRNHYIYDTKLLHAPAITRRYGEIMSSRPADDDELIPEEGYDDPTDTFTDDFFVLRADKVEPFRLIAINSDCSILVINSTEKDENDEYKFSTLISEYPVQLNDYIGLGVYSQYAGDVRELKAVSLRVDGGEPCYSVLLEFLGSSGEIRFLLGDECIHRLYDYYDINGSRDYDGKDSTNHENPVDVTGEYADADTQGYVFQDVNGGYSNNWDKFYENIMNDRQIIDFRKELFDKINLFERPEIIYGKIQD